ncbi:MAG: hypothetical protein MZU84_04910 [Sphingobacterium sp.]|nr:hypothetical protein [Sphingobacterium sp.]
MTDVEMARSPRAARAILAVGRDMMRAFASLLLLGVLAAPVGLVAQSTGHAEHPVDNTHARAARRRQRRVGSGGTRRLQRVRHGGGHQPALRPALRGRADRGEPVARGDRHVG